MWGCCADEHSPKGTHPRSMSDMYMGMQSHACHMHVTCMSVVVNSLLHVGKPLRISQYVQERS